MSKFNILVAEGAHGEHWVDAMRGIHYYFFDNQTAARLTERVQSVLVEYLQKQDTVSGDQRWYFSPHTSLLVRNRRVEKDGPALWAKAPLHVYGWSRIVENVLDTIEAAEHLEKEGDDAYLKRWDTVIFVEVTQDSGDSTRYDGDVDYNIYRRFNTGKPDRHGLVHDYYHTRNMDDLQSIPPATNRETWRKFANNRTTFILPYTEETRDQVERIIASLKRTIEGVADTLKTLAYPAEEEP